MRFLGAAILALCVMSGVAAAEDMIITWENKDLTSDPPEVQNSQAYVSGDKMMVEMEEGESQSDGPEDTMIYRGDKKQVWLVRHEKKSYMVLDKETMAGVSEQVSAAMKEMQERLAEMPEDQRKMIEEQMKGRMPGLGQQAPPVVETRKTGETKTISGYECVCYENLVDGEKKSQIWVTDWKKAGVPSESFEVFKKMSRFFQEMLASMPAIAQQAAGDQMFQGMDDVDGFPVLFESYEGSEVTREVLFKEVEKKTIDPSTFEIPEGYEAAKLGGGR
jgi:hypothetical protein